MSAQSFLKRLVRSVVDPDQRLVMQRRAHKAMELCRALLSERGEVSGAALARDALTACNDLPDGARRVFFDLLAGELSPDPQALGAACDAYRAEPTAETLITLQHTVEPPRQELFRRLNMAPGGTAALVAMRAQVLPLLREHPEWKVIDTDLAHLFGSWFNRGFLTLARIDWNTPAIVLEKLIQYEAVHEIKGWKDLRRRLEDDRRCFAFFHPALPNEPLIFIEVALARGISSAVQPLLAQEAPTLAPQDADTAVFYSITNCQLGLRGISFGNLLIKQVAQRLGTEFPRIKTFSTLSPIPGFCSWLARTPDKLQGRTGTAVKDALQRMGDADWISEPATVEAMRRLLQPLCAHYLLHGGADGGRADAVAHFHLGNGARLERLNWLADTSSRGLRQSAGMMVNYLYRLEEVEANHETYVRERRVVASAGIRKLARECPLAKPAAKR